MKKIFLILILFFSLTMTAPSWAANTVAYDESFISVILDGSTDWDSSLVFTSGIRVAAITFYPNAVNDVLIIRNKTATGTFAFKCKDVLGGGQGFAFPSRGFGSLISKVPKMPRGPWSFFIGKPRRNKGAECEPENSAAVW